MRGIVLASIDEQGTELRIETEIGPVQGIWRGDSNSPVNSGEALDIELEFPNARSWHDIAGTTAAGTRSASPDPIFGTVVELFEDGILMVAIGTSIVQVELSDSPSADPTGQTVAIPSDDLEIYPTGV